jgi:hypothetical protein
LGVYRGSLTSTGLSIVVDQSTNSPIAAGPFTTIFGLDIDGDSVGLFGSAFTPGSPSPRGLFTQLSDGSGLATIATSSDPIRPGTRFAVDSGVVVFEGFSDTDPSLTGIYSAPLAGGALTSIVDLTTAVPGKPGKTFTNFAFRGGGFNDGVVAFRGRYDGGEGIYTVIPGQAPVLIVDTQTALPTTNNGSQTPDDLSGFGPPSIDNGEVVFSVEFDNLQNFEGEGFYVFRDNVVSLIVDNDTPQPNDSGDTFRFLGARTFPATAADYVIDNGRILFDSSAGIYQFSQGDIVPVVQVLDDIEGDLLFNWGLSHSSLSGDDLIFYGVAVSPDFQSGSLGVYLTTIPEPASLAFLTLGAIPLLKRRIH